MGVVEAIIPKEDVNAIIAATVSTDDSNIIPEQALSMINSTLGDKGFNVKINQRFISSSPTFAPSIAPTTSIPSTKPSITGVIAKVALTQTVDENISSEKLDSLSRYIRNAYGVSDDDVVLSTEYSITGTIGLKDPSNIVTLDLTRPVTEEISSDEKYETAPEEVKADVKYLTEGVMEVEILHDVDRDAFVEELEKSLAELLGVHAENLEVEFDEAASTVSYTVESDTFED